jgi:hypothetical protein
MAGTRARLHFARTDYELRQVRALVGIMRRTLSGTGRTASGPSDCRWLQAVGVGLLGAERRDAQG